MDLNDMMCFRDRTWCSNRECVNKGCTRRITDELRDRATELNIPVCYGDLSRVCSAYSGKGEERVTTQSLQDKESRWLN